MIEIKDCGCSWLDVLNVARLTQNKAPVTSGPSIGWIKKLIKSRHSPLRMRMYLIKMRLPQWVAMHFSRHVHAQPYAGTSRTDITGKTRDPYAEIQFALYLNAEEVLNISEKRLCGTASLETRKAWREVIEEFREVEPLLAEKCVPSCVAKGHCTESFKSCGYSKTEAFKLRLAEYQNE